MSKKDEVLKILSTKLRDLLVKSNINFEGLQELRIRIQEPFIAVYKGHEYFISKSGKISGNVETAYIVTNNDMKETLSFISNYSLYAYEDEIRQGFITVQGGHRVGIAGKIIMDNNGIKTIKSISFINIRMSHEKIGCSEAVTPYIYENNRLCHTLIISPPGFGKTTLLRDMIRLISNGCKEHPGMTVGVVDERSEIGACYCGVPQNDIGVRTDVLDCCPKAEGMLMMIRSMGPSVIAIDEIGKREDVEALAYVMNCGCKIVATVHGESIEDIRNKPVLRRLVEERFFKRYIVLSGEEMPGKVSAIFDEHGSILSKTDKTCAT